MTALSRDAIQRKAESLLKKLNIYQAPVDLDVITDFYDIDCKFDDLDDDVSGFLLIEDGRSTIVINELQHANRQRFTLAHELGHFFLHKDKGDTVFIDKKYSVYNRDHKSSLGEHQQEKEANLFAASLLMPVQLVHEEIEKFNLDLFDDSDSILLSKKFGVSLQALGFRLAKLGYEVGQEI